MNKRNSDAQHAQNGACNPRALVKALDRAMEEVAAEPTFLGTASICRDPAVRLIAHQLAFLLGVAELDANCLAYSDALAQIGGPL